jgi:hypothetical protein
MEMMISIVLFSIIVLFLYQALDMTKKSNRFYSDKLNLLESKSNIKRLLFEDIINSDKVYPLDTDKNQNAILGFKTSNIFHNPFYTNITYFLTKNDNLVRCESKNKFNKRKTYNFIENSYIDIVEHNVTKFRISYNKKYKNNYSFYIQYKDKSDTIFTVKKMK